MDINEVTLLGSIKEISKIQTMKNGNHCCFLGVLTDIPFQKKDETVGHIQDNHRIIAYGKYATIIKEKSSIDQKIFIQGRLKTKSWTYNNTSFEKEFIVLERFKLYPPIQNESKEQERLVELKKDLENYQDNRDATQYYVGPGGMGDLSEYPKGDEELVFNNSWDNDYEDFFRDYCEYYDEILDEILIDKGYE